MEATCPRCSFSTTHVDAQLQTTGICPECGGQTYFSHGDALRPDREGGISATYEVGCGVGIPFATVFIETRLPGFSAGDSNVRSPPEPPTDESNEHQTMSDEEKPDSTDEALGADLPDHAEATAASDQPPPPGLFDASDDPLSDLSIETTEPASQESVDAGATPSDARATTEPAPTDDASAGDSSFDSEPREALSDDAPRPSHSELEVQGSSGDIDVDVGADHLSPEAADGGEPSEDDEARSDPSPVASPQEGLPAHLQLPSIDFSLPVEGTEPGSTPPGADGTALPAHLNLPSFPQFDLPPVPGDLSEADRRLSDGTEVSGLEGGGGSFADFDDESGAPVPPPPPTSETEEGWSVGVPATAPPPMPPPRPKAKAKSAAANEAGALPSLPSLPSIPTPKKPKRDPTLIDRQLATEPKGGGRGMLIAAAVLVLLLAGIVTAFFYKDALIDTVADPTAGVADNRAEQIRFEARKLWADGLELQKGKKLDEAIRKATESLKLDPSFGKSHLLLGVVYAEMKRADEAVVHYKRYLELEPNAEDAKDVAQIISDYETAQRKQANNPEDAKESNEDKGRRRKRR